MQFKKLLALILSFSFVLSSVGHVFAEEIHTIDMSNGLGVVVQPLMWDGEISSEEAQAMYDNFPVQMDKIVNSSAQLTLLFQYLKTISEGASAEIHVVDFANKQEVFSADFAEAGLVQWENVENNKTYGVIVSETVGNVTETYAVMLKTADVTADFPVSFFLNDYQFVSEVNAEAEQLMLRESGLTIECNHPETEECIPACSPSYYIQKVPQSEFNTFYNTLDENKLYEIQVNAVVNGLSQNYRGFISTYAGEENFGVFTRGYTVHPMELNELQTRMVTGDVSIADVPDVMPMAVGDSFSTPYEYKLYRNIYDTLTTTREIFVSWVAPEYGSYTFETIGNTDTMFVKYNASGGVSSRIYGGGSGENARMPLECVEGSRVIIGIRAENGSSGDFAFRVIHNAYTAGDQTNYRDIAQANYQNGILDSNTNPNKTIDYTGDVDIFVLKSNLGVNHLEVVYPETHIAIDVYSITGTNSDGSDSVWKEETFSFRAGEYTLYSTSDYANGYTYFEVRENLDIDYTNNYKRYELNFYPSDYMDGEEVAEDRDNNNTPGCAATMTLPGVKQATLHRNDFDYYAFNSGDGGDFVAFLWAAYGNNSSLQYDIYLYDAMDINLIPLGDVLDEEDCKVLTHTLEPDTDYLLYVKSSSPSTIYNSHPEYYYELEIETGGPVAELNNDVALSHNGAVNIIDLDSYIEAVVDELDCCIGSLVIGYDYIMNDVVLYYNDTELTADVVNNLPNGSYNLVAKYRGVAATGGTITLTVTGSTEPAGVIVELENITLLPEGNIDHDWVACARIAANVRLLRENLSVTTKTIGSAVIAVSGVAGVNVRAGLEDTAKAANYFYTNGLDKDSYNFLEQTISIENTENILLGYLQQGQAPIILLTSADAPTDMTQARYLLLYGMDTGAHTYKVYDPAQGQTVTITHSMLINGGYNGNNNLKFAGSVVEFV